MTGPVAIVGCGLIGGSLLRALRQRSPTLRLLAIDPDPATRQAIDALGMETRPAPDSSLAKMALIVLATPLPRLLAQLGELDALLGAPGPIVTDVAGVKAPVLAAAARSLTHAPFVGAHPMAGSERRGFGAADPALFVDRAVAICAGPGADEAATEAVEALWKLVGARTIRCTAEAHDRAVARVSHLPHLVAAALARVAGRGDDLARALAGPGLRDTTRVAGDETIRPALASNPAVAALAREVADELRALAEALDRGESVEATLADAAAARRRLYPP